MVHVARPVVESTGTEAAMTPSTRKLTEPVARFEPGPTWTVKVTACPNTDAALGVAIVVELVACPTASVPAWKVMA